MALDISIPINGFLLNIKVLTNDIVYSILYSSYRLNHQPITQALQCARDIEMQIFALNIIPQIAMNFNSYFIFTNSVMLMIVRRDTTRPLCI